MDETAIASAVIWLSWINVAKIVGAFFVAIGVVMEFGGDFVARPLERKVEEARQLELTRLRNDTARLSGEAETARAAIAEANARALEAQVALEKFRAPRSLSDTQLATLAEKLKAYENQEFDVTTFWDLKEPLSFTNSIYQALTLAGWKYMQPQSRAFLLGGMSGIQVWVHPDADRRTKDAAAALVAALNDDEMAAELRELSPQDPAKNKIRLHIGTKS